MNAGIRQLGEAVALWPRYDFSKWHYTGAVNHVIVICPEHGAFEVLPGNLIRRVCGCPVCGRTKAATNRVRNRGRNILREFHAVHGDRFEYPDFKYRGMRNVSRVHCRKHGSFNVTPDNHLRSAGGCYPCGKARSNAALRRPKSETVRRARAVHGDKYQYRRVVANLQDLSTIFCKQCETEFPQSMDAHIRGQGCPDCAKTGFNHDVAALLYYLALKTKHGTVYKIGITNRTVAERFPGESSKYRIVKTWRFKKGRSAYIKERQILNQFTDDRYTGSDLLRNGNSELFSRDILNLDLETK